MSLVQTFQVGDVVCHTLDAGRFRLDGGAMFGIVPKPLWERRVPADDKNRIPLAMRCLLVEHERGLVLIDTGLGNKEGEKFQSIYAVENLGTRGATRLEDALREVGYNPADVRWVINTHLHFDHAGGNTCVDGDPASIPRPAFPNARYVVQRGELDFARNTNERTSGSYLAANFDPISDSGQWDLVEGPIELLPGIRLILTPGHVPFHQSVVISDRGQTACFIADLVPTTAHLPLPWIMGYDVEPLVTLEQKRRWLATCVEQKWRVVFEHDPERGVGRVVRDGKAYRVELA